MPEKNSNLSKDKKEEQFKRCFEILKFGTLDECYEIIPHLSILRDNRFLPLLESFLESENEKVREMAICAVCAIGTYEALKILIDRFEEEHLLGNINLQILIVDSVGEIGFEEGVDFLISIFDKRFRSEKECKKVKVSVIESLGAMGQQGSEKAIKFLENLLDHKDSIIRANAITSITTAYWNRPNDIPEDLFNKLISKFDDTNYFVVYSLISALENLADIGCKKAMEIFPEGCWVEDEGFE